MIFLQPGRGAAAKAVVLLALLTALGSCSKLDTFQADNTAANEVQSMDLTARFPSPIGQPRVDNSAQPAQVYPGTDDPQTPGGQTMAEGVSQEPAGKGYNLNFNNAQIPDVAKALLGDVLGVNYAIDPRVQGTVTLNSGRPVAKSAIVPLFERVLAFSGASIVKDGKLYKIVPSGEEIGTGGTDSAGHIQPGFGLTVLPLRYVSAQVMLRALDSFAAKPGMLRIDRARNTLLIEGASNERASTVQAALALDVNWMKNQSVGIFPVRNASPETIISELQNIADSGKGGASEHLVRFQPMVRLNAILAVAKTQSMINQVKTWIARLDRADYDSTTVRVYHIRYGDARTMAGVLREVFTGQANTQFGQTAQADLSQLTPGSSLQHSTNQANSSSSSGAQPSLQAVSRPGGPGGAGGPGGIKPPEELGSAGGNTTPVFQNVRITADTANNSLLIYANRDQYKIIERAIFELDKQPLQVAIDVTVAEITLNNELQYGVQFYLHGASNNSISLSAKSILRRTIPGFNMVLGPGKDPRVVLNALRKITDVKVLSNPALVVLDNQPAMLQVGNQIPVTTQQAESAGIVGTPGVTLNTVTMQDTGVILKVTPRVNANGSVTMNINQEISDVVNNGQSQTLTPTISKRVIQSSVAVQSGQTVLLGGLISSHVETDKSGLPIISDIKLLGDLLSQKENTNNRTELIIFIRPQIIRNGVDAQLVAEELRSKIFAIGRSGNLAPAPAHGH